ncbi:Mov34/MPN/PAD-1 family protein [Brevibacillus sp. NPDC003359]|uniref:Mov34/MPN/PAD-1 family protein n=1 Tax=unclassified Brevibacillus TaxID=2684853 RepID=UPI0036AC0E85
MIQGIKQFFWKTSDFLRIPQDKKKTINLIASQDARVYEVFNHPIGTFVRELDHIKELDLIVPGFQFNLPRIPGILLGMTISFFRAYCEEGENEVMVEIYWDKLQEQYHIYVPKQIVSKNSIISESEIRDHDNLLLVMHIHSHNTMPAYFSAVDNRDEVAYMLYGVIGSLNTTEPDLLFRVGKGGIFYNLPAHYVFENVDVNSVVAYPKEWHQQVELLT